VQPHLVPDLPGCPPPPPQTHPPQSPSIPIMLTQHILSCQQSLEKLRKEPLKGCKQTSMCRLIWCQTEPCADGHLRTTLGVCSPHDSPPSTPPPGGIQTPPPCTHIHPDPQTSIPIVLTWPHLLRGASCRLIWCQTDLGANALNWPKLVSEDRRFGGLAAVAGNLTADHFDGVMAETLLAAGKHGDQVPETHCAALSPPSAVPSLYLILKLQSRVSHSHSRWQSIMAETSVPAGATFVSLPSAVQLCRYLPSTL